VPVFGVSVDSDPREIKVVVKEVQRDIITRGIIHLTLQEVKDDDVIRINVPIVFSGEPDSVTKKRSSLMTPMVVIEIFAKPANIPDHITVDLSGLGENDKIVVGDLQLPDGVSTHVSGDALVATTFHMKAVVLEAVVATVAAAPVEGEAPADGEEAPEAPAAEAKKEK
jgi:large subunit ribosomal protein L25